MEAAALYAFAKARDKQILCFAHATNQMALTDGDFEKGEANGARDALHLIDALVGAIDPMSPPLGSSRGRVPRGGKKGGHPEGPSADGSPRPRTSA
jgi:hypothetical protein